MGKMIPISDEEALIIIRNKEMSKQQYTTLLDYFKNDRNLKIPKVNIDEWMITQLVCYYYE